MPGMLDIHTHYDVEVLDGPVPVRVAAARCDDGDARVVLAVDRARRRSGRRRPVRPGRGDPPRTSSAPSTNTRRGRIARSTLPPSRRCRSARTWPPSSPLRHADGDHGSGSRDPEPRAPARSEQAQMERMLSEALDAGFVGMSSQQLLFDKLDGDTCLSRTLPSTYAKPRELRRLKSLLRRAGRVLQSGPDIESPLNLGSQVAQSLGIFRRPLKTSIHPLATPCPQRRPRDCRLAGIRPTCRVRLLRDTERDAATELLTATRIPPNEASGSFRETGTVNADCEPRSVDQRDPPRER